MDLSSATPVVNAVGRIGDVADTVVNPSPVTPGRRDRPEQLADALDASDTLNESRTESKSLGTMARHVIPAAVVGGLGLGTKFGVGAALGGGDVGYSSLAGAGLGALGATGAALWAGAADRATLPHRLAQARKTLESTSPELRHKLTDPKIKRLVRDFQQARHTPYQMAELGGTLGGVGGGVYGLATGPKTGDQAQLFGHPIGMTTGQTERAGWTGLGAGVAGIAAGSIAGLLWRRHKRNQVIDALKKQAEYRTTHGGKLPPGRVKSFNEDVCEQLDMNPRQHYPLKLNGSVARHDLAKTAGLPVGQLLGRAAQAFDHPRLAQPLLREAGANAVSNVKAAIPRLQAGAQPYLNRAAGLGPLDRFSANPIRNSFNALNFKGVPAAKLIAGAAGTGILANEAAGVVNQAQQAYDQAPQDLTAQTGAPVSVGKELRSSVMSSLPLGAARALSSSAPTNAQELGADTAATLVGGKALDAGHEWAKGPDAYQHTPGWLKYPASLTPLGAGYTWLRTRGLQLGARAADSLVPTSRDLAKRLVDRAAPRALDIMDDTANRAHQWWNQQAQRFGLGTPPSLASNEKPNMLKTNAQLNQPGTNAPKTVIDTGGRPNSASNRSLMRALSGRVEAFAGGHALTKLSIDLQRISVAQALKGHESAGKKIDVPADELKRGVKSEMEHTKIPEVAQVIALDHEAETPGRNYYDPDKGLPRMERELAKQAAAINLGQLERGMSAGSRMSTLRTEIGRTPFSEGQVIRTPVMRPVPTLIRSAPQAETPGRTRVFPSANGGPAVRVPGPPGMAPTAPAPKNWGPLVTDVAAPLMAGAVGAAGGVAASGQIKTQAEILRAENPRDRAEAIVYSKDGILGIDKTGYLLCPGGGVDEGETHEQAVSREAIEEADRQLLDLDLVDHVTTRWPDEGKMRDGEHDGERTKFYLARDGGRLGTRHKDREPFGWIGFDDAVQILDRLIERDDWARDNNLARRAAIEQAKHLVETEGQDAD